jgi:cysteine desulfurase / selenocysteine lyase
VKKLDPRRIRRQFPILEREVHGKPLVYLDSASTSQKPREVIERLQRLYAEEYGHPEDTGHALSKGTKKELQAARARVARLIHAPSANDIVFCRGATEAINILASAFERGVLRRGDEVLLTEMEHHSNIIPWQLACQRVGATVRFVPMLPSGQLDVDRAEALLTERTKLFAFVHVSNVTGIVTPVKRLVELAHARGVPALVDGAQAAPHLPVDVQDLGCDFYIGSGHKLGAPSVGFLFGRAEWLNALPPAEGGSTMAQDVRFEGVELKPLPQKFEAGEPATADAIGLGAALQVWEELGLASIEAYERALTQRALALLDDVPGVRILGSATDRIAIVSFVVDGVAAQDVAAALDRRGIAVRAGDLTSKPQLRALGVEEAVRASLCFFNTDEEIDALVAAVRRIVPAREAGGLAPRVQDLLVQALETEIGGIEVYEAALRCARVDRLKEEWTRYLEETREHERRLRQALTAMRVDADLETPGRLVVRHTAAALVHAMWLALEAGDLPAAQVVAAECVVHAETKDHLNWELLGELAETLTGDAKAALTTLVEEVTPQEEEHLYHTMGWARELWIQSLGLPAVLPPPEELRHVRSAIGAERAKTSRRRLLRGSSGRR